MKKPLISIITACFNSESTIRDTIESVLNQTYNNIEYIIVDGKSNDSTLDIIQSYQEKFKERKFNYLWISEKDIGIYDAFNKGVKLANGNWISFIGADDRYTENAVELYMKNLPKKDIDLMYSNIKIKGKNNNTGVWSWDKFRRSMNIAHVGAFHHKHYFKKYGIFDTSYKIAGDYELLLRAKEKLRTHKLNEITVIMSGDGISNSNIKKVYSETTRAKKETAGVSSFICQLDYYKWLFKYKVKKIANALVR
jgi:glycosyltransferase involved in cell wall biosynthesis